MWGRIRCDTRAESFGLAYMIMKSQCTIAEQEQILRNCYSSSFLVCKLMPAAAERSTIKSSHVSCSNSTNVNFAISKSLFDKTIELNFLFFWIEFWLSFNRIRIRRGRLKCTSYRAIRKSVLSNLISFYCS